MVHYTVVIAVRTIDDLDAAMAPWDENRPLEEYRVYQTGEARDHELYWTLQYAHEQFVKMGSPDVGSTGRSPLQPIGRDAELYRRLPDPVDWRSLADISAELYGDEPEKRLYFDPEAANAYTISTFNYRGQWGRWTPGASTGGHFLPKPGAAEDPRLIRRLPGTRRRGGVLCDGGPKGLLDLDGMREWAAHEAAVTYDALTRTTPCRPRAYGDGLDAGPVGGAASTGSGPLAADYDAAAALFGTGGHGLRLDGLLGSGAAISADMDRRYVTDLARAAAVPGFATLTLDRRWMKPGTMAFYGNETGDPHSGYLKAANEHIDDLPDDILLIAVECHLS